MIQYIITEHSIESLFLPTILDYKKEGFFFLSCCPFLIILMRLETIIILLVQLKRY